MLRVVKEGGVVVLVMPMKCETFDLTDTAVTSWDHLMDEYNKPELVEAHRFEHYREWAAAIYSGVDGKDVVLDVDARAKELFRSKYPIHFHTWDQRVSSPFPEETGDGG
jgi:hypothetical protein